MRGGRRVALPSDASRAWGAGWSVGRSCKGVRVTKDSGFGEMEVKGKAPIHKTRRFAPQTCCGWAL